MVRRRAAGDRPYAHAVKVERARALRRQMTTAERLLWDELRGDALGMRARPQHVISGWIVDFYFARASLVVEVDGDVHDLKIEEDGRRSDALSATGLEVLRFRNDEVIASVRAVIDRIAEALTRRRTIIPAPDGAK